MKAEELKLLLVEMEQRLLDQIQDSIEMSRELIRELNERATSDGTDFLPEESPQKRANNDLEKSELKGLMPRMGISHEAFSLFEFLPGNEERDEFMIRYTQMQYAFSRKEWLVWAAYCQMLLEGLTMRGVLRFVESMGQESQTHPFALLAAFFENSKIRDKNRFRREDPVAFVPPIEFQNKLIDRSLGWHYATSSFFFVQGHLYYRIVAWDQLNGNGVNVDLMDFNGQTVNCVLELPGLSVRVFEKVDIVGIFFPDEFIGDINDRVIPLDSLLFLCGPLPMGKARDRQSDGKKAREVELASSVKLTYSTWRDSFEQWKGAGIYAIKANQLKNSFIFLNFYFKGDNSKGLNIRAYAYHDLKLTDRLILAQQLMEIGLEDRQLRESQLDPSKWWDDNRNGVFNIFELLAGMRNRYCHLGELRIEIEEPGSQLKLTVEKMILCYSKVLSNANPNLPGSLMLSDTPVVRDIRRKEEDQGTQASTVTAESARSNTSTGKLGLVAEPPPSEAVIITKMEDFFDLIGEEPDEPGEIVWRLSSGNPLPPGDATESTFEDGDSENES
jgi:hypothetical protein